MQPPRGKRALSLEVRTIEIVKLWGIDMPNHRFSVEVYISLAIEGGALDAGLSKQGCAFPVDETGAPTFRPPAGWYLEQLQLGNAIGTPKRLESVIITSGDDLLLNTRWEAALLEIYELKLFPFDKQALTVSLSINSRTAGRLPVQFAYTNATCRIVTSDVGFAESDAYHLSPTIVIQRSVLGSHAERMFPAVTFTMTVARRPDYFIYNAVIPFSVFSLLAVFQFSPQSVTERDIVDTTTADMGSINHRAQLSLMLVLVAATYTMAIGNKLPAISYLTALDIHMLMCSAVIVGVALQCRLANWLVHSGATAQTLRDVDTYSAVAWGLFWLLLQAGYALYAWNVKGRDPIDPKLSDSVDPDARAPSGRKLVTSSTQKLQLSSGSLVDPAVPGASSRTQFDDVPQIDRPRLWAEADPYSA